MTPSDTKPLNPAKHAIQFFVSEESWLEMKQVMPHRGEISSLMATIFTLTHNEIKKENIQYGNDSKRNINNVIKRLTIPSALQHEHSGDVGRPTPGATPGATGADWLGDGA